MENAPKITTLDNFDAITVSVASPETILSWSHGEVKKPETINYRTQKPERDGLFCEKIFGPTKNWECYCGKYKRIRYKGVICEKCGVEVTRSSVRRERMGHLKLAVPVSHIWYLRSTPSRVGLLLGLPIKAIEQVIYFAAYIATEVDLKAKETSKAELQNEYKSHRKRIQDDAKEAIGAVEDLEKRSEVEKEFVTKLEELDHQHSIAKEELDGIKVGKIYIEMEYRNMSVKFGHIFKAETGAEAIRNLLAKLDLEKILKETNIEAKKTSGQKQKKLLKRIKLIGGLFKNDIKPEWMILTVLPVLPPDLRPMVQLDGGRFATSDLNDLYRRIINRNNRLKRLIAIGAPEVICRNEKRMLQEAVDALLNNSARTGRTVFSTGEKRKLRSLSEMLKGKQGRFRQNLLGKRVDYSGRSVIVIGPKLKLNQCGVPKTMALELFKPFVIGRLIRDGHAHNIKNAEKLIQNGRKEVWDILEEVTQDHYVLLNRAPTLHRLGIQAFQPVLVEGKAIQVHPLVCAAFNADFDGDQMAIHIPLSKQAQIEAKELIAANKNLLKPSDGHPTIAPTQDIILGCYYLTKMVEKKPGEGMVFGSLEEAMIAHQMDHLHIQAKIKARVDVNKNGKPEIIETSLGRLIFNSFIPEGIMYINEAMGKKKLSKLIAEAFEKYGNEVTTILSDSLKKLGYYYATKSGISIASSDMIIPKEKEQIIEAKDEIIKKINNKYWYGLITDDERYVNTVKVWSQAKAEITNTLTNVIENENNIHYMIDSGARGNWGQVTQLCGMKGLVANPAGKTIELPIKSNLKEGFTILEYFIATHGGRKGKSDTALKTAEAGYLTRRLIDTVQNIVIKEYDCGTKVAHKISRGESEIIGEPYLTRLYGRILTKPLVNEKTGEVIAEAGTEIESDLLEKIDKHKIDEVYIRSVITCQTEGGICVKCYGKDLGTNEVVRIGTPIGVIAAQSIGEPGTQLTMRTFHMGGVAGEGDITQGLTRVEELFEARSVKNPAILAEIPGKVKIHHKGNQFEVTIDSEKPIEKEFYTPAQTEILVKKGDKVKAGQPIGKSEENKSVIKSDVDGKVTAIELNGIKITTSGPVEKIYEIPFGKVLKVKNGQLIEQGAPICSGHLSLRELMRLTDLYAVQKYILNEVKNIYAMHGQTINDKHIEVIVRQMFSKVRIMEAGDCEFLPGEIIDYITYSNTNRELAKKNKAPCRGERLLLGLTRVALYAESWLSAASFQETIRVLVEASVTKKVDTLNGLKENVIIGKLIPAGETYRKQHPEDVAEMEKKVMTETKHGLKKKSLQDDENYPEMLKKYNESSTLYPII
ncbi:MAG: DNA-directed RNA polymerase subunit beta, DNA-directed RNA polymerase subunit beta' [Candidatus Peregrinibacteria bacterium GW2011_GWC2_39_14]|nr:MAG: DNA-directed RNA polymerase subunit beta' [Candidatus Peregrinibacteria bacterium GW2011_GWA2_38_36]KKR06871.1 MAG: DNA-directed RNA polymerase subunit beta, DNA-directed RNA polymerase subunit beta' [Candidatus Peregrinibacteria bacterium GW2011_GWC2_39_14]